ncbi:hypothetical protein OIDMADRAFT_25428 [Oidiodendron maius Zn]|uniref:Uncharacterized protein n=1 Tax=Oidiodendron maius (strain Zn) TaxID=913774 RepID=A0A0C3HP67_OIDMZ|nr:hypothetical protein OIDMADRAFT_25428 [Oidiodendron maius Zn]
MANSEIETTHHTIDQLILEDDLKEVEELRSDREHTADKEDFDPQAEFESEKLHILAMAWFENARVANQNMTQGEKKRAIKNSIRNAALFDPDETWRFDLNEILVDQNISDYFLGALELARIT